MRVVSVSAMLGVAVGVLFTGGVLDASAQVGRARVQEGNRLYEEGRFGEAHQKYLEALAEAPESSVIPFNDGNALYQDTEYEKAMESYERAIATGDPALASSAWYNLGNALYRQQQLEPSLDAYKQALRLNPADPDAKHNLERVLEQLQEQQDQQNDPNEDSDENPEDENEDQQEQDQQQEGDDQQQGEQPNDEEEGDDEDDGSPDEADEPPEGEEGAAQPRPGQMTPEEAERLLDAIDENPEDVNRKPAAATGRKPKKPW
jgi:Ca-activated chloride channel family protein